MAYYKITNKDENHYGFQYKDGLNVLIEPFNDDPYDSCCAGGLYFTDIEHVPGFADYGCYLREVFLPKDDPDFKMVKDMSGGKWRANKLILGQRYNLWEVATLELLRERGTNSEYFKYLFLDACENEYYEVVKYFVENKLIDPNTDIYKYALHYACEDGHYEIIKFLVEKIKIPIHKYESSLYIASAEGHYNIVQLLVENGVCTNNKMTLNKACLNGHFDIVKYLMEKGANINDESLYFAANGGHSEIFRYLIEKGADINNRGYEILRSASYGGNLEIIKYLIYHQSQNVVNYSDILIDFIFNDNLEIIRLLVDLKGAKINTNEKNRELDLLCCAITRGNLEIFLYLLEKGSDIDANSYKLLEYAILGENIEIIKFLIKKIDVKVRKDLLCKYINHNNFEAVKILIENGANDNENGTNDNENGTNDNENGTNDNENGTNDDDSIMLCICASQTRNYVMFRYLFENIKNRICTLSYTSQYTKIYTNSYILYSAISDNQTEFIKFLIHHKIIKNNDKKNKDKKNKDKKNKDKKNKDKKNKDKKNKDKKNKDKKNKDKNNKDKNNKDKNNKDKNNKDKNNKDADTNRCEYVIDNCSEIISLLNDT